MRWYQQDRPTDDPDDHWKWWFAWHPVQAGNWWVWLEWVQRWKEFRGIYTCLEYRLPDKQETS